MSEQTVFPFFFKQSFQIYLLVWEARSPWSLDNLSNKTINVINENKTQY